MDERGASREGQDAFNAAKGSISARADADVTKYDPYQRSAIADFKAAVIYPNLTSSTHDAFKSRLDDVMTAFQRTSTSRRLRPRSRLPRPGPRTSSAERGL